MNPDSRFTMEKYQKFTVLGVEFSDTTPYAQGGPQIPRQWTGDCPLGLRITIARVGYVWRFRTFPSIGGSGADEWSHVHNLEQEEDDVAIVASHAMAHASAHFSRLAQAALGVHLKP